MSRHRRNENYLDDDYDDGFDDDIEYEEEDIGVGKKYLVKYVDDGKYYDAKILKLEWRKKQAKIRWLDFDEDDWVDIDLIARNELEARDEEREEPTEFKYNVDKKMHPRVIGKGGATIKELQSKTGAKINVPGKNDTSSFIKIFGLQAQIDHAKDEIDKLCGEAELDEIKRLTTDRTGTLKLTGKAQELFPSLDGQAPKTLQLDLPKWVHPRLIGKGGSILNEIKTLAAANTDNPEDEVGIDTASVAINIPRKEDESSIITITAPENKADKALAVIMDKLERWNLLSELRGVYEPSAGASATDDFESMVAAENTNAAEPTSGDKKKKKMGNNPNRPAVLRKAAKEAEKAENAKIQAEKDRIAQEKAEKKAAEDKARWERQEKERQEREAAAAKEKEEQEKQQEDSKTHEVKGKRERKKRH